MAYLHSGRKSCVCKKVKKRLVRQPSHVTEGSNQFQFSLAVWFWVALFLFIVLQAFIKGYLQSPVQTSKTTCMMVVLVRRPEVSLEISTGRESEPSHS